MGTDGEPARTGSAGFQPASRAGGSMPPAPDLRRQSRRVPMIPETAVDRPTAPSRMMRRETAGRALGLDQSPPTRHRALSARFYGFRNSNLVGNAMHVFYALCTVTLGGNAPLQRRERPPRVPQRDAVPRCPAGQGQRRVGMTDQARRPAHPPDVAHAQHASACTWRDTRG